MGGLFAGALGELLSSYGRIRHQDRHNVRRQGCSVAGSILTTYLCLRPPTTAPSTAKKGEHPLGEALIPGYRYTAAYTLAPIIPILPLRFRAIPSQAVLPGYSRFPDFMGRLSLCLYFDPDHKLRSCQAH